MNMTSLKEWIESNGGDITDSNRFADPEYVEAYFDDLSNVDLNNARSQGWLVDEEWDPGAGGVLFEIDERQWATIT